MLTTWRSKLILDIFFYFAPKSWNFPKKKTAVASNFRSVSAVDANAVQRAKARAQYANMSRMKMAAGPASVRKYRILSFNI